MNVAVQAWLYGDMILTIPQLYAMAFKEWVGRGM